MAASGGAGAALACAPAAGYGPLLGTGEDDLCARARPAPRKYAGWARADFGGYRAPRHHANGPREKGAGLLSAPTAAAPAAPEDSAPGQGDIFALPDNIRTCNWDITHSCARTRPVPRRYRDARRALLPPQQHLAGANATSTAAAVGGTRANNKRPREEEGIVSTNSVPSNPRAQLPPRGDAQQELLASATATSGKWTEAEMVALIDGVEKHGGIGKWKDIKDDNLHVLQTHTARDLRSKWQHLVRLCGAKGSDVGNGRIQRRSTTLPERKWKLVVKLNDDKSAKVRKRRRSKPRAKPTAATGGARAYNTRPRKEDTVTTVSERSQPCAQLPPGGDVCAPEATRSCPRWKEAETIALIDGVEKHGVGSWKAIVKENPLLLQARTRKPGQLRTRWHQLVKICRLEGADMGRGRILRALTTLHESQWARIARLGDSTPLTPEERAEVDAFIKGVQKHGIYAWEAIEDVCAPSSLIILEGVSCCL